MIVSEGRSFIFVHIPKTGGTSLALALESRVMKHDVLIGDTPKSKRRKKRLDKLPARGRLWKHSRLSDLDGWIGADDLERFFVFTIVRNPWDRMVSYYSWLRAQSFNHPAVRLAGALDFGPFLRHPETVSVAGHDAARSYVSDANGLDRCQVYVRLERLKDDLGAVERHLGFNLNMPHVNASVRRQDYRSYYDTCLVDHVGRLYADDIARFGYEFDPTPRL